MSLKKVTKYIENVGRSMKYAAVDVIEDKAPAMASLVDTNEKVVTAVATGVRNRQAVSRQIRKSIMDSDMYEAAEQAKTSVFEDIRTGNFYNKAREDAINDQILGFGDDDFSFDDDDFSFDDDDEDFDDYEDDADIEMTASDAVTGAVERSSQASAGAITNTIAGVAEYSAETQKALTHSQMMTSIENTSKIIDHMLAINENLVAQRDMDDIHITIGDNAKRYYEESMELKKEDNAMLRELLEMQRNIYDKESIESGGTDRIEYSDIVDYRGIPDLKQYFKMVGQNIESKTRSVSGMGDMFEGGNFWMTFAASPLEFIPKYLISSMMSDNLDDSVKALDKSMSGFFSALATKLNSLTRGYDSGIIGETIGEIFGVRNRLDKELDVSSYDKGPVPWDGKARQALIEVIPAYLAQLVSLQSGKTERVYDYDKGVFVDSASIQDEFDEMIKSASKMATIDFRHDMMERFDESFTFTDPDSRTKFEGDMDTFLNYFFENEEIFDYNRKGYYDYEGLSLEDSSNYNIIEDLFKTMPKNMQLDFYQQIMSGRSSLDDSIRTMESEGDSIYRYLGNKSGVGESFDKHGKLRDDIQGVSSRLSIERDKAGHTVYDYLSKITNTLLEGLIVYPDVSFDPDPDSDIPRDTSSRNRLLDRETYFGDNKHYSEDALREKYKPQATLSDIDRYSKSAELRMEEDGLVDIDTVERERGSVEEILNRDEFIRSQLDKARDDKKVGLVEELLGETSLYKKGKLLGDKAKNVFEKPQDIISDVLNRVDNRMYEIIYGREDDEDQDKADGVLELMILNMKDTFQNVNDWIDEKVLTPIGEKSSEVFGGILEFMGIEVDDRGVMRSIRSHLFGETDDDGEYIQRGIFTDTAEAVREDITSVKETLIGGNRHLRAIAKILQEYSMDSTLWNTFDQLGVLHEVEKRIRKVRSMSLEDRRIAKRIRTILSNTTEENVADSLTDISNILIEGGYTTGSKSIWGQMKESIFEAKDEVFGTETEIDKLVDIVTDRDAFQPKNIRTASSSKINMIKFKPLYNKLQDYIFMSDEDKAINAEEIGSMIDVIEPSSNMDQEMKNDLLKMYKNGVESGNFDQMAKDMLKLFSSRGGIKSANRVLSMLNRFNADKEIRARGSDRETASSVISGADLKMTMLDDIFEDTPLGRKDKQDDDEDEKIDGSYEKGYYKVQKEEETVHVHEGERILTKEDADDLNPIIDALLDARDKKTESSQDVDDRLASTITNLLGSFKPSTIEESDMKSEASKIMDEYSEGEVGSMEDVFDKLSAVLGVDDIDPDEIKPDDTLMGKVSAQIHDQTSKINKLLFGTKTIEDDDGIEEEVEIVLGDIIRNSKEDYSEYIPKGVSGALMGGAAGLLPGMIGGPLAWATIGAGANIIKSSETAKEILFGNMDKDGYRMGGVIPKSVIDGFEKFAPGMAKSGAIGAASAIMPFTPWGITGGLMLGAGGSLINQSDTFQELMFGDEDSLFGPGGEEKLSDAVATAVPGSVVGTVLGGITIGGPLGLLGGAMLGGAGSLTLASETFQEMMFGTEASDEGLISHNMQDRLKDILPASAIATLGIGAIGPFGILGSSVLGTVTGIATTSDEFKDAIFGPEGEDGKRDGGFVGSAKSKIGEFLEDNVKKPFQRAMDPIKYEIKQIGGTIKDSIVSSVDSVFEAAVGMPLGEMVREKIVKPFTDITQRFFSRVGKILGGVVSAPFKAIGWIGDNLRDKHGGISYSVTDPEEDEPLEEPEEEEEKKESFTDKAMSQFDEFRSQFMRRPEPEDEPDPSIEIIDQRDTIDLDDHRRESSDDGESPVKDDTASSVIKEDTKEPSIINKLNETISKKRDTSDIGDAKVTRVESEPDPVEEDDSESYSDRADRQSNANYIKDIRDEVYGQLDGVGYNVSSIRKILANTYGDAVGDGIEGGRGNKQRRGFFGRIVDFIMSPIDFVKDIGSSIMDGVKGFASKIGDVILAPFQLLGDAVTGVVKGIGKVGSVVGKILGGMAKAATSVAKTVGNIALDLAEGAGKAASHLLEGIGLLGKGVFGLLGEIPSMVGQIINTGMEAAKIVGRGVKGAAKFVGRGVRGVGNLFGGGVKAGVDAFFGGTEAPDDHMEVTVIGGKLDEVDVVNIIKEIEGIRIDKDNESIPEMISNIFSPKEDSDIVSGVNFEMVDEVEEEPKETPNVVNMFKGEDKKRKESSKPIPLTGDIQDDTQDDGVLAAAGGMPTPHGMLTYRRDFEGKLVPIKDKIYEKFMKDSEEQETRLDIMKESTARSADADEETAESVKIFDDEDGKGGGFLGLLGRGVSRVGQLLKFIAPLAIGAIPLLAGKLGGKLDDILPEGKMKDVIMRPLDNAEEKSGAGMVGRSLVQSKNPLARATRGGIEKATEVGLKKGLETGGPQIVQKITEGITGVFGNEKVVSAVSKVIPGGEKICSDLAANLGPMIAEKAGEAGAGAIAAKMASNMFVVITVGLFVKDFGQGMSRAEEILRMDGNLPLNYRIVAGLANAINNRLTFGLVPLDWILKVIIPFVGTKDQRKGLKEAQDELNKKYIEYKEREMERGKSEDEIMTFDEYNVDHNAGWFRKRSNKRKYNKRVKKAKRKQDDIVEEELDDKEESGYGFGISNIMDMDYLDDDDLSYEDDMKDLEDVEGFGFGKPEDFNIEDHGCGAKALGLIYGDDENKIFKDSLKHMDREKGLDPKFFREYAGKLGGTTDMYKLDGTSDISALREGIKSSDVILSANIDGSPHYLIADYMDDKNLYATDPSTKDTKAIDINDLEGASNFAVAMKGIKERPTSKPQVSDSNLEDVIGSRLNIEKAKTRSDRPKKSIEMDDDLRYLDRAERRDRMTMPERMEPSTRDDGTLRNLVTIIVSLLKELIKHAQNIDIIVDLLGDSLNVEVGDKTNTNLDILNAISGLDQDSSDEDIESMAMRVASIAAK